MGIHAFMEWCFYGCPGGWHMTYCGPDDGFNQMLALAYVIDTEDDEWDF